jgi:hypothetical protein
VALYFRLEGDLRPHGDLIALLQSEKPIGFQGAGDQIWEILNGQALGALPLTGLFVFVEASDGDRSPLAFVLPDGEPDMAYPEFFDDSTGHILHSIIEELKKKDLYRALKFLPKSGLKAPYLARRGPLPWEDRKYYLQAQKQPLRGLIFEI